ncbi:DUF2393 family protein [Campylobacter pinnipediorum]|uniref:DUF2393 family protein n=1 Tax=Campylobacter pinnipediorum TaxID=1965231 RepID=UPI00084DF082|nr:DUF2393 family protein [Campylobacter pinnipediorum]AQW83586.1 putative DUF2393 domain protein [Campylobacter pinnipediorum subsp. pinnipediorum]AQW85108.1 putative DUF2393 domain protein [Campylobacter pinnipediorum subsp. pinnipediorum]OPA75971.1 hypothetical protein BFG05_05385 [Campylobacter pinnipediorum subsp. pinnipediorum]
MLENIKHTIFFIFKNATLIDYLSYGWVFLAFIFMVVLSIFFTIKWYWQIGFLVFFASFVGFFIGLYFANINLNKILRNVDISEIKTKQLKYSNTLILDLNITNKSKHKLKICKFDVNFYTISKNKFKNYINSVKPFLVKSVFTKEPIDVNEMRNMKITVNNFAFVDYNITTRTDCF